MNVDDVIKGENKVFGRTALLSDDILTYCPGCGHGVVHRLIMEVVEELGIVSDTIGVCPVGCSVIAGEYMKIDMINAAHGRAPAVATGIKRTWPGKFVFTYQGDGDLAAIGTNETIHVCNRGENITVIFINNGIYGMTGGQMAPTTLDGMKSSTSPFGRNIKETGSPLKITEIIAGLDGTNFVSRHAVHTPGYVRKLKKALKKAFELQNEDKGLCFIEVLTNCNMNWRLPPVEANKFIDEKMIPYFPLGDIKVDGKIIDRS
jgi:2-oxoglutarate/2-oxoacid ferredoxin oxidoreductase subunit beta